MEGSSNELRKGAWSAEEDSLLKQCIDKYGEGKWHQVPLRSGLNRCRKSCRLRWLNYLKPSIKRGKFSCDEVDLLLRLYKLLGNRWSLIAGRLPGRTANDVKNYWNIHLAKREITFPANIPAQELNVLKPQPPSFSHNNGPQEVGLGEVSNKEDSITFSKDEEKCEFLNNQMVGEIMLPDNMLEESQEADAVGLVATTSDEAYSSLIDSMSMTFDVEQLWDMFYADNGQFTDGNPDYSHLQSLCKNSGKGDSKN